MLRFILITIVFIGLFQACTKETQNDFSETSKECDTPFSSAGNDQLLLLSDSTKLEGSIPNKEEHSYWSVVEGTNYEITDYSDPQSYFSGEKGEQYSLVWTTENACGNASSDTVIISFNCEPINCDAGEDQYGIKNYLVKLNASTLLEEEVGYWTIANGMEGVLDHPESPNATLSVLREGTYILTWTITNSCNKSAKDTVRIEFVSPFNYGTLTDIDGNTYKTIKIGNQTWMAENLKTTKYNDGTPIANLTTQEKWSNPSQGGYCWYNNDIKYKDTYGAIYNHYSPIEKKVCPTGWHVPSDNEWLELMTFIDGSTHIYREGYSTGNLELADRWESNAGIKYLSRKDGGTNNFGFSAIKSSLRGSDCILWNGEILYDFSDLDDFAWWSSTTHPGRGSGYIRIDNERIYQYERCSSWGMAIRCIKD